MAMARVVGSMEVHITTSAQDDVDTACCDDSEMIIRQPSTRPIDQRWDRSRGIVFASTPRNQDSSRLSHIAFGSQYVQTRRYAQRALPASRSYQQPGSSPKPQTTTLSDNPYHTPTPLRIASDSQKVIDLAKEKDLWKAKEAEATLKHKKTLDALEDQRKRAQAREDALEADLRKERASSQQQKRDHTRALDQQRKDSFQDGAMAMSRLERRVADLTQVSEYFKRKAAELEQDMERQGEEHKRDLVAQQRRLEVSLSQELAEQTRQSQIRTNERATYEEYRRVYKELDEVVRDFYHPIVAMQSALFGATNRKGPPPTHSDGMNKINPIILMSRGKLFRRLDECQQELVEKHEGEGRALQSLRYEMQEKFSDFSNAAHESRTQSRYHRIDQTQTKMETADILHYVANDLPIRQEARAVAAEIKKLAELMDREQDATVKASLRAQREELLFTRASLSKLITLFARIREIAALEALKSDSLVEKEVFIASLEAESRIEEAGRMWSNAIGQSSFVNLESDVSIEDQTSTRNQYTSTLRQTHDRLDAYKANVRKRVWLEQHLGRTQSGLEERVDAIIESRIEKQREDERGILMKFGVQRLSRHSSFARSTSVSPTRSTMRSRRIEARASSEPPKASSAINSTLPTTTQKTTAFVPSLSDMERILSVPNGTEKVQLAADVEILRRHIANTYLPNLRRKRELARKQNDERLIAKLQANIEGVKAKLADAAEEGPTKSNNTVVHRYMSGKATVQRPASIANASFVKAGRRTFSSSSRPFSSPELVPASMSDDMASFDSIESAMQRTTITEPPSDRWHTMSKSGHAPDSRPQINESPATHTTSTADLPASSTGTVLDNNGSSMDAVNMTSHAQFRISDSAYREAALASPSSNAAYWSYRLYKDSNGKSPSVHYCTNQQQAERELQHFIGQPLIGFDMEWDSTANKNSHAKRNASLIQIACEDRICLIHVARFPSDNPDQLVPPTLRHILESTGTIKAGVNIQGDARRMREYLGTEVRAQFELSHLYKVVTFVRADINKTLKGASMAVQVQKILRLPLKKDDVRVSAWARPLNQEQCDYSASDAYAGYQLFRELETKREMMDPTPPRPAWAELKLPLVLGDGTMLRAKPKSSIATAAKASATPAEELDDDAEEEFYDAVETLDEIEALVVPLQGISISYPSLPSSSGDAGSKLEIPQLNGTTTSPATPKTVVAEELPPTAPERSSVSELDQADSWIAKYRKSWRVQPGKSQASVPNLRAHHLWHEQRLETTQVATLLRDPPLSINTVASYVLEAIRHEGLPFEPARLQDVLAVMPDVVKAGRYKIIVEKLQQAQREVE